MNKLSDIPLSSGNQEPLYNIGIVTRMTGISMATLRAWERRYGFPEARRTSGGHRLYSENDVLRLRWVKNRIEEGMQTAQAIHALQFLEAKGTPIDENQLQPSEVKEKTAGPSILPVYQEQLLAALIDRQLDRADVILGDALAASSPEDLILNVIGPALAAVGDAWEENRISVATEHLATNYLRQRLLMWMLNGPPPMVKPPIVLACAPNEWHEGSLLILGALLRRRRWPVAYLGQAVPLPDLAFFIRDIRPSLAVLIAMREETASELIEWPQWLPEVAQRGKPIIGYGGLIFSEQPEWRIRMAGVFLGKTLEEGLTSIENLLHGL